MGKRKYLFRSRHEAEDHYERVHKQNTVNQIAISLIMHSKPTTIQKRPYTARIYGADRCDGGIVVVTFAPKGQSPSSAAYYTSDWVSDWKTQMQRIPPIDDEARRFRELVYEVGDTFYKMAS